jgi:hypothetical protein
MNQIKIIVLFPKQLKRLFLGFLRDAVIRCRSPGPVAYALIAFFPYPFDHPPYLPVAEIDQ